jgi:hypothetical protein
MHRNEKVKFLFPSHMGFGYHGTTKKRYNQPLWCTVTQSDFMSERLQKQLALKTSTSTQSNQRKK